MWPGLMLQNLTTREPDHDQLAVAIAALEAVLAVESPDEAATRPTDRDRRLEARRVGRATGPRHGSGVKGAGWEASGPDP